MKKENETSAKRYIELENWLLNNIQNSITLLNIIILRFVGRFVGNDSSLVLSLLISL